MRQSQKWKFVEHLHYQAGQHPVGEYAAATDTLQYGIVWQERPAVWSVMICLMTAA